MHKKYIDKLMELYLKGEGVTFKSKKEGYTISFSNETIPDLIQILSNDKGGNDDDPVQDK